MALCLIYTFAEYIAAAPLEAQQKLHEIHACLREAVSAAEESLKWGIPAFSFRRILFTFAGFKHHIGFYPTPSAINAFEKELSDFETSTGTIQFPLDIPLPASLIRKIATFRARESEEKDVKWMPH